MRKMIDGFARALLTVALALSLPALAKPGATGRALDALLSMPSAQPTNGGWGDQAPDGFDANNATEKDLIDFLNEQKNQGAKFNTRRHFGTILHHAIRSRMEETTLWLLQNGADPSLTVNETAGESLGGRPDAMGIAIRVGAWSVVDKLRKMPAFSSLSPTDLANRYWPMAIESDVARSALQAHHFPLPTFGDEPRLANCLLLSSLASGQFEFALLLLDASPLIKPVVTADESRGYSCQMTAASEESLQSLSAQTIGKLEALDARVETPLLPFVLPQLKSANDVQAVLRSRMRKPWSDAAWTRTLIQNCFGRNSIALTIFHTIPAQALVNALDDDKLVQAWIHWFANKPTQELAWALAQTKPERLTLNVESILSRWNHIALTAPKAKDNLDRIARWTLLTNKLTAPLPEIKYGVVLRAVPAAVWRRWFELGYRGQEEHWAHWIHKVTESELRNAWPIVQKYQPEVAQRSLTWLIAPVSVGLIDDQVAKKYSYSLHRSVWGKAELGKAMFLQGQGVRVKYPRRLAAAIKEADSAEWRNIGIKHGWFLPPLADQTSKTVPVKISTESLACKPFASQNMRSALAHDIGLPGPYANSRRLLIEFVQPISIPGQIACGWLASGGDLSGSRSIDEDSFFDGRTHQAPCGDTRYAWAIWDEKYSNWKNLDHLEPGELIPVQFGPDAKKAIVALETRMGRCGTSDGAIFEVSGDGHGTATLSVLAADDFRTVALNRQCSMAEISRCLGVEESGNPNTGRLHVTVFADQYWKTDKQDFLQALNRLDRAALKAAKSQGIFYTWSRDAIVQISDSAMPLADKRKRMAWVFAQKGMIPGETEILGKLIGWLPPEDWGPIIRTFQCGAPSMLKELERLAFASHKESLRGRLAAAADVDCEPPVNRR